MLSHYAIAPPLYSDQQRFQKDRPCCHTGTCWKDSDVHLGTLLDIRSHQTRPGSPCLHHRPTPYQYSDYYDNETGHPNTRGTLWKNPQYSLIITITTFSFCSAGVTDWDSIWQPQSSDGQISNQVLHVKSQTFKHKISNLDIKSQSQMFKNAQITNLNLQIWNLG